MVTMNGHSKTVHEDNNHHHHHPRSSNSSSSGLPSRDTAWPFDVNSLKCKLSSYVLALRFWSLSISLMPVALGCALAQKATGDFSVPTLLVTCVTALSVHAAGNVVNTYYDYQKGIDSQKSDDRTLVDAILTTDEIVHLGAFLYALGCVGFIVLVILSPATMEHLAVVYFGGLSSSFLYTGGIGLKYIGLGDFLVIVIFGPVTVLFSYLVQTGTWDPITLLYATPLALNTEAILHCNNSRDMETDRKAGIVTLAILIGRTGSHVLFAFLLFSPYIMCAVMGLHCTRWLLLPIITIPSAFRLEKLFRQGTMQRLPQMTARLNFYFGALYIVACTITARHQLPWLHIQ